MDNPPVMEITPRKKTGRQCAAKSKQSGQRCKRNPIPGGTVCKIHGGGTPSVKAKAAERLAALVDPAIEQLGKLVRSKNDATSLGAVKDVLDRNGFKPKDHVEHSGGIAVTISADEAAL
jgi:hypothetical protein